MAEQNFFLENVDFEDILEDALIDGEAIEIARIVELTLESPDSDGPISLDAIWPRRSPLSTRSERINGIVDDFEDGFAFRLSSVAAFEGGNDGVGVKLTGTNSEVYSEDDEFFLVFEYHEDLEDFINFDYPIRIASDNPITDNDVFLRPFTSSDVQLFEIKDLSLLPPEAEKPTPVPESDPILGILLIAIGVVLKRKLSRFSPK